MATDTSARANSGRTALFALTMNTGFLVFVLLVTTAYNRQLVTSADECNARLAAQAAAFRKQR